MNDKDSKYLAIHFETSAISFWLLYDSRQLVK